MRSGFQARPFLQFPEGLLEFFLGVQGSRGLIYFVHQFKPMFREAALLDDSEILAGVTALNRQITELAS